MLGVLFALSGLAGLIVLATPAAGQPAEEAVVEPPSAETVLRAYVEATGGEAAHRAASEQKQSGTLSVPAMSLEGTLVVLAAAPDKILVRVDFPGLGSFIQGANGDAGWASDPFGGDRTLPDGERALLQRDLSPDENLDPNQAFASARTVGIESITLDGQEPQPAYKLELVTPDGSTLTEWFAVDSGLRLKQEATWQTEFGPESQTTEFSDYRVVGDAGLLVPFVSRQTVGGREILVRMDEVVLNPGLPGDGFDPPAEAADAPEQDDS